jgi:hypothetical protein
MFQHVLNTNNVGGERKGGGRLRFLGPTPIGREIPPTTLVCVCVSPAKLRSGMDSFQSGWHTLLSILLITWMVQYGEFRPLKAVLLHENWTGLHLLTYNDIRITAQDRADVISQ